MPKQTPDPESRTPGGDHEGAAGQNAAGFFVAGAGVARVEDLVLRQRALDRARLDEYAELLAASQGVTTSVELAYRSLRAELATALHVSEYTVERELDVAHTLATRYPNTRDALGAGLIGLAHVSVICDAGVVIGSSDDAVLKHALYEEAVLTYAVCESPGRLRPIARRLAEQFAEISLEERHERARQLRRVEVYPLEDGMAELCATLPAELAYAIRDRLQRIAKEMWGAEAAGERAAAEPEPTEPTEPKQVPAPAVACNPRTLDEVRADTFTEILLLGNPYTDIDLSDVGPSRYAAPGFIAHLQVTVPVDALTGSTLASDAPAATESTAATETTAATEATQAAEGPRPVSELAGYGPISTRIAAELLESARDVYRVDHDRTGQILQIERYTPTKRMRRLVEARDQHCRFPGCTRVPLGCDIDHTIAWQDGGATSTDNLECLCKGHHTLKHHSAWVPVLDASGTILWTSPSGDVHVDRLPRRGYDLVRPTTRTAHKPRAGDGAGSRAGVSSSRGQLCADPPGSTSRSQRPTRVRFTDSSPSDNDQPF